VDTKLIATHSIGSEVINLVQAARQRVVAAAPLRCRAALRAAVL
jgi:hypothetical protein